MIDQTKNIQFFNSVFPFTTILAFVLAYLFIETNPLLSKAVFAFGLIYLALLYLLKIQPQKINTVSWLVLSTSYLLFIIAFVIAPEEVTRITLFIPLLSAVYFLQGKKAGLLCLLLILVSINIIVLFVPIDIGYSIRDVLIYSSFIIGFYLVLNNFESVREQQSDELYIINKKLKTELNRKDEELTVAVEATQQDPVTGLMTRSKFTNMASFEIAQAKNHQFQLSLLVLDINEFKLINTVYDQQIGDNVLNHIAQAINKSIRKSDLVVRWAADEFFILLPKSTIEDGVKLADKIKATIASENQLNRYFVSVSFGFAQYSTPDKLSKFIGQAEDQLIRSKQVKIQ